MRKPSEESIRTEFCEGSIPEAASWAISEFERNIIRYNEGRTHTSDRAELIERIKRGESPTWVPKQALQDYYKNADEKPRSPSTHSKQKSLSPLLPAAELQTIIKPSDNSLQARLTPPIEIQRPRSALHAGDFTEEARDQRTQQYHPAYASPHHGKPSISRPLCRSPTTPWYTPSSSSGFPAGSPPLSLERYTDASFRKHPRVRAPSLGSYSSSYVLKAPTTPLVQQSNNNDLDFSPIGFSTSPTKTYRRHTLPPHSSTLPKCLLSDSTQENRHLSYKDNTLAYQKHHPRRSLTSNWSLQALTSPNSTSHSRPRRPSCHDISPSQTASMVGSFEESILRGSMSTAPSKPLDFTAQIGVLGMGDCKPKCPAHVTIPFPAVFYSWGGVVGRNQKLVNDEPSPYVGHIDLQHSLLTAGKRRSRERSPNHLLEQVHGSLDVGQMGDIDKNLIIRPSKKRRRIPSPSLTPQGGSYRIPQEGQLQIIIKNPNKTAVKLFLVPYDLTGMETGTKTFIRQRCYSTEPLDSCIISALPPDSFNKKKKQTLRYLIHLNICSPAGGRFYLYQHIRVVFANRVPDNKEQLQNEIQVPQPRYSIYKPTWDSLSGSFSGAGARPIAEKAYRRRSSGFEPLHYHSSQAFTGKSSSSFNHNTPTHPIPPIPPIPLKFDLSNYQDFPESDEHTLGMTNLDRSQSTASLDMQSPSNDKIGHLPTKLSSSYKSNSSNSSEGYGKLSKGDSGYGGFFGRPGTPEMGEGLLARKLRRLGVKKEEG